MVDVRRGMNEPVFSAEEVASGANVFGLGPSPTLAEKVPEAGVMPRRSRSGSDRGSTAMKSFGRNDDDPPENDGEIHPVPNAEWIVRHYESEHQPNVPHELENAIRYGEGRWSIDTLHTRPDPEFALPATTGDCQPASGCNAPDINVVTFGNVTWMRLLNGDDGYLAAVNYCTEGMETFHRSVLGFLQENEDIWRWVLCLLLSDHRGFDGGQLISDMLNSPGGVSLKCKSGGIWCPDRIAINYVTDPIVGTVFACTQAGRLPEQTASIWLCEDPADSMCAMIQAAAVLLHELVHAAWYLNDAEDSAGCKQVEAIEHTFIWACLQRYPGALNASCCAPFADSGGVKDSVFMSESGRLYISKSCRSGCQATRL